jgi:hypothetical protein
MPKRPKPEKVIQTIISKNLQSYITAVENRAKTLDYCRMAFKANTWEEKAPRLSALAAAFSRVCDTMSHELQNLYALEERIRKEANKDFRLVIEHVESPWRPEYAQSTDATQNGAPPELQPPETGQSEA